MDRSPSGDNQYCTNCGERIRRSANYCYYCGEPLAAQGGRSPGPAPDSAAGGMPRDDGHPEEHAHSPAPPGDDTPAEATRQEWDGGQATGRQRPRGPGTGQGQPAQEGVRGFGKTGARQLLGREDENPIRTVLVATAIGAGGLLSAFVLLGIGLSLVPFLSSPFSEAYLVVMITFQFAWFVIFGLTYLRTRGLDWESIRAYIGVRLPSLKDIGLILVTWLVMIVAAAIVAQLVMLAVTELFGSGAAQEPAENPVGDVVAENPEIFPAAVLFMFLVVGPAEETLFRGVVQGRLRERLSPVPAIVIASAVFASAHILALWGQDPVAIGMTITILFVPSLGFGAIYEYTSNIVVPALLHGFHNSVVVTIVLLGAQADVQESVLWLLSTVV